MIEMRIVDHGLGVRPEIQYRFITYPNTVVELLDPPNSHPRIITENVISWSEWKTAEYVKLEDI